MLPLAAPSSPSPSSPFKSWCGLVVLVFGSLLASCGEAQLQDKLEDAIDEKQVLAQSDVNRSRFEGLVKTPDGRQLYEMKNGKKEGRTVGLDKGGRKLFDGNLRDGREDGLWTTYYENGLPRWRGRKKEGINNGPFTMWYPDGAKKMEGVFVNGLKEGLSIIWFSNGVKWQEQRHKTGQPHGIWKKWDLDGKLVSKKTYANGTLVRKDSPEFEKEPSHTESIPPSSKE